MRYLSVCSGIEAATVKVCADCQQEKPIGEFHRQGKRGRHAYCRACYNARYRGKNRKPVSADQRRAQNIKSRYGLDEASIRSLLEQQGGVCAICKDVPSRPCIDHSHETGDVRGILCHRCNILIGGWDDPEWRSAALKYLGLG